MASSEENWIDDLIDDFIHSSVWSAPVQTFIDANCACFDYDDDNQPSSALLAEQKNIHRRYQALADSLMASLSNDLKLEKNALQEAYMKHTAVASDEAYEQMYSAHDFDLFAEMMKRKNLILQLQALVNLQLEHGILKPTDASDDRVLQLLLQATSTPNRRVVKPPPRAPPSLKHLHVEPRDRRSQPREEPAPVNDEPKSIESVPEDVLREKLRELTIGVASSGNDRAAASMSSRQSFLKRQRDLIIDQQRQKRAQELDNEMRNTRPQSAAHVARQAMEDTAEKPGPSISQDELDKRRAMAAKLRREVVDKQ